MTRKDKQSPEKENEAVLTVTEEPAHETEPASAAQADEEQAAKERDLFDEDLLDGKKRPSRSASAPRKPKKKNKNKKGFIAIGVLCAVLAVCLGVLYFYLHQTTSRTSEIKEAEQAQLQDYTTLISSAAMPEGWDPAAFEALKAQALSAYDQSTINLINAAENGDDAAATQLETIETVSVQPNADKFKKLFSNLNAYPSYAATMLASDPGLIDFVLEMPNHPDGTGEDVDLDVSLDTVPDLKTTDPKWAYVPYGNGTIANEGSAVVAIADVFSYLTKNPAITPLRVANFAKEYGYDLQPESENGSLFTAAGLNWGVNVNPLLPYQGQIDTALSYGNLVIASIGTPESRTYIVITGADEAGNWTVLNPSSSQGAESVSPETIKDQLQSVFAFY